MKETHEFTLVVNGISELTPEVLDALFEAGCDDATVCQQNDRVEMDFARSAPTRDEAVESAARDVAKANIGATATLVINERPDKGAVSRILQNHKNRRIRKTGA